MTARLDDIFTYEPEGIALYSCSDGSGYWFTTDQDTSNNTFHIFNRIAFKYIGSFYPKVTANTDGVWLTQKILAPFPKERSMQCTMMGV